MTDILNEENEEKMKKDLNQAMEGYYDEVMQSYFMDRPLKDWEKHCSALGIENASQTIKVFLDMAETRDRMSGSGIRNLDQIIWKMEDQARFVIEDLLKYVTTPGSTMPEVSENSENSVN